MSGDEEKMRKMEKRLFWTALYMVMILFALPLWAADGSTTTGTKEGEAQGVSLESALDETPRRA